MPHQDELLAQELALSGGVFRKAYMYQNAPQAVPAAAFTKMLIDTILIDPQGICDIINNRIRPNRAGIYLVTFAVHINAAALSRMIAAVWKNGAAIMRGGDNQVGAGSGGQTGSGLVQFNGTTDYVELVGWIANASPANVGSSDVTYLSLVGPFT